MIRKKWLDLIALFINTDARPSWHIFRRTSKQVTSRDVKQSTVTWIATWLRVWTVLFSLPGSVMGRETVYLCYDSSEVLLSWWDRNSNESRKRLPFTDELGPRRSIQDVSLQISVTNCVPLRGYTTTGMVRVVWAKLISYDLQTPIHKNYNGAHIKSMHRVMLKYSHLLRAEPVSIAEQ